VLLFKVGVAAEHPNIFTSNFMHKKAAR
jgi:hypothetical protein